MPLRACAYSHGHGVLRLSEKFALRTSHSAQDDRGKGILQNDSMQDYRVEGFMKEHEYFAYIVCSRSGTLYIGMTNSIYRRALKRGEIEGFAAKYKVQSPGLV